MAPKDSQIDLLVEPSGSPTQAAAQTVVDWAGCRKLPKRFTSASTIARNAEQMRRMMEGRDWGQARIGHIVALYAWCHEKVYGVPAKELTGYAYTQALLAAKRQVLKEFEGSLQAAVAFIRWTWQREAWRERKRREEGSRDSFRISWRYQFGPALVTDYRLDKARKDALGS